MMRSRARFLFLLLLVPLAPPALAVNTAQIIAASLSVNCLHYRVVGLCYWLQCTPFGCTVRTSVKVRHNIPELVVSAYAAPGQNPWQEAAFIGAPIPGIAEGGSDTNPRESNSKTKIRFKNADAIGHPGGQTFFRFLRGFGYGCTSPSVPFQPYFISTLDAAAWRTGIPESFYPEALTPGEREVGQPGDLWGNVYPRIGALGQTHDYKAGAVIAQRAADIITRTGQPHVYRPLTASARKGYWPPDPVQESLADNHRRQMLSPVMSSQCITFPDGGPDATYADRLSETGDYAWALWRPYSCCQRRGQTFLGSAGG